MDFNLYLIGDKNLFTDEQSYLSALDECFSAGIKAFQLRQKDIGILDFIKLGEKIKKLIEKYENVKFFVNDRADAALALDADGVHLNKNSIPVKALKKALETLNYKSGTNHNSNSKEKVRSFKIIYSSHSLEEAIQAQKDGADAVSFSPIFKTKNQDFQQGAEALRRVVQKLKIPVFALGGINKNNIDIIKQFGARYVAVQSGVFKEKDIAGAIKLLTERLT